MGLAPADMVLAFKAQLSFGWSTQGSIEQGG